jgi:hypothetical protein
MSPTVPGDTIEGRVYNDLRNLAKRKGRDPSEYNMLCAYYSLAGCIYGIFLPC